MNLSPVSELQISDAIKSKEQLLIELANLRRQVAHLKAVEIQRQETERKSSPSQDRFQQIIHSLSDHTYITEITQDGDYLNHYLSPQIETLTGYPQEQFLNNWGFWSTQVIHPDDRAKVASQAAQLAMGQDSEVEYRLVRADGEIVWVSDRGVIHLENASKVIYGVVSDITERKQLEDRQVAIYHLGQELHLLRDETKILKRILKTIAKILQGKSFTHAAKEEPWDVNNFRQLFPPSTEKFGFSLPLNQDGDSVSVIIHNGQPTHLGDLTQGVPIGTKQRTQLSVPMKVGERVIGMLNIESGQVHRFTWSDRQLLQILADQTAISIENTRLYNETRQRVEELAAMSMIGQAIISTLDLQETLTVITDHAIRLLNVDTALILLYNKEKGNLWCAAASGEDTETIRGKDFSGQQGVANWVVQHGEAALIPDVSQEGHFVDNLDLTRRIHSVLCVPLQTGIQTIGAIELRNKRNQPFDQKDLRLLGWLAMPAATAIENAYLYEAQRKAREQAETLREATSTLTSTLNLNHLLDNILLHLEQVMPYDNAYVFLREGAWLNVVSGRGAAFTQKHLANSLRRPANDTLYRTIQETGRPLVLTNAEEDARLQVWPGADQVRAWMGVPLMVRGRVIGYLTLDSRQVKAYGQTEANLAQAFANQAAVAIQNARLFEEVQIGHKRLQSLSRRLVQSQEMERRHIARELHDEAGQALTTLRVGLHLLAQEAHHPKAILKRVFKLKRLAESVLENLHRLAMDLRPASLDHLGLVAALDQFIETFSEQHHLKVQFETADFTAERLSATVEACLYRIVQEALTNVARHAQATRADVFLKRRGDQIVIIIEDDGQGFDVKSANYSSRLGLLGMRERAEMLDGQLIVESSAEQGTTVYVEVPHANTHVDR